MVGIGTNDVWFNVDSKYASDDAGAGGIIGGGSGGGVDGGCNCLKDKSFQDRLNNYIYVF